jgi:lipopolysaccharide transport system ATP-binding protein
MSKPVVDVRGVGKQFKLGGPGSRYGSLREVFEATALAPLRWVGLRPRAKQPEPFWALKDITFEVPAGQVVGIIGHNGAGKSTLLKILSRITRPTVGEICMRGNVAALLEVGTGFHPELTGRENVFLNGAIMGLRRAEVTAKFDEIVAFAEVDQFIDTPVKRYSSGMRVRLAFAVAAHLQPEILIVDEVLAVGDASFQKKCLNKMEGVAASGRTVLFVSHNMAAVTRLCSRGVLLRQGKIVADAPVGKVVATYLGGAFGETPTAVDFTKRDRVPGSEDVRLLAARITSASLDQGVVDIRRSVCIEMDYEVLRERRQIAPNIHVFTDEGHCAFVATDASTPESRLPKKPGRYRVTAEIPGNFLSEGMMSIDVAISSFDPVIVHAHERGILTFQVMDPGEGDSARGNFAGPLPGVVRPLLQWTTKPL